MCGPTERDQIPFSTATLPASVCVILACAYVLCAGACGARSDLDGHDRAERASVRGDGGEPLDGTIPGDGAPGIDGSTPGRCVPIPPRAVISSPTSVAPSLAFDGRTYGLLWADRLAGGCRVTQWHVDRLDQAGNRTGSSVALPPGPSARGTLHFHAGAFWAITGTEYGILARRIGPGGGADSVVLVPDGNAETHDAVITRGGKLAIAHSAFGLGHPIQFRIFEEITAPEPWITPIPSSWGDVRLAESDEGFVVAMTRDDDRVGSAVAVSLIAPGEAAGEPVPIVDESLGVDLLTGPADVARLATGSAVFSVDPSGPRAIAMTRIDASGAIRDVRQVSAMGSTHYPTTASDVASGEVGLIWKHAEAGAVTEPGELRFRRFDAAGEALEPEEVILTNHEWSDCRLENPMSLLSTGDGFAFATANVTADGGREIVFGKVCR